MTSHVVLGGYVVSSAAIPTNGPVIGEFVHKYTLFIVSASDPTNPKKAGDMPFALATSQCVSVATPPEKKKRRGAAAAAGPPVPKLPYARADSINNIDDLHKAMVMNLTGGKSRGEFTSTLFARGPIVLPCTSVLMFYKLLVNYTLSPEKRTPSCAIERVLEATPIPGIAVPLTMRDVATAVFAYCGMGRIHTASQDRQFTIHAKDIARIDWTADQWATVVDASGSTDWLVDFMGSKVPKKRRPIFRSICHEAFRGNALGRMIESAGARRVALSMHSHSLSASLVQHYAASEVDAGALFADAHWEVASDHGKLSPMAAMQLLIPRVAWRYEAIPLCATGLEHKWGEDGVWPPEFWTNAIKSGCMPASTPEPENTQAMYGMLDAVAVYNELAWGAIANGSTRLEFRPDTEWWTGDDRTSTEHMRGLLDAFVNFRYAGTRAIHLSRKDNGTHVARLTLQATYEYRLAETIARTLTSSEPGVVVHGEGCTWARCRSLVDVNTTHKHRAIIIDMPGTLLYAAIASLFRDADRWTFVIPSEPYKTALLAHTSPEFVGMFRRIKFVLPEELQGFGDLMKGRRVVILGTDRYAAGAFNTVLGEVSAAALVVLVGDQWRRPRPDMPSLHWTPCKTPHDALKASGAVFPTLVSTALELRWADLVYMGPGTPIVVDACTRENIDITLNALEIVNTRDPVKLVSAVRQGPRAYARWGGRGPVDQNTTLWLPEAGISSTCPPPDLVVGHAVARPVLVSAPDAYPAHERVHSMLESGTVSGMSAEVCTDPDRLDGTDGLGCCVTAGFTADEGTTLRVARGRWASRKAESNITFSSGFPAILYEAGGLPGHGVNLFQGWGVGGTDVRALTEQTAALRRTLYALVSTGVPLADIVWIPVHRAVLPNVGAKEPEAIPYADATGLLKSNLARMAATSVPPAPTTSLGIFIGEKLAK